MTSHILPHWNFTRARRKDNQGTDKHAAVNSRVSKQMAKQIHNKQHRPLSHGSVCVWQLDNEA